jgi:hypothetical protein
LIGREFHWLFKTARTIAKIPDFTASDRLGHRSIMTCRLQKTDEFLPNPGSGNMVDQRKGKGWLIAARHQTHE